VSSDDDPLDRAPLCVLVGPTASGKSELALAVAERAGAEILSMDSMQVYRGMDIGTAKPSATERARVRHHLLDLVEPDESYDGRRFLEDARRAVAEILERGGRALFVGGTGFYLAVLLRGLFDGPEADTDLRARLERQREERGAQRQHAELQRVDPAAAERIHPHDAKRVVRALEVWEQTGRRLSDWQSEWGLQDSERVRRARLVGIRREDAELEERIRDRAARMLDAGWREEVLALRDRGGLGQTACQALGYAEVLEWAEGRLAREEVLERITLITRQFARRQRTWTRKFPIDWIEVVADEAVPDEGRVRRALQTFGWDA
jgi:tRNA dimethylallyltransferase